MSSLPKSSPEEFQEETIYYLPPYCSDENITISNDAFVSQIQAVKVGDSTCENDTNTSDCPLFSVVILCYNNENMLSGMVKTIIAQNYPRIQLIISDDGSKEFNPQKIYEHIRESNPENIEMVCIRKNKVNVGTVKHVHRALQLAEGEYIVFAAADDRFNYDEVFSDYVEVFDRHPEAHWIVGRSLFTTVNFKKTIYVCPTNEDNPYFIKGDAAALFSRWSRRCMAIPCSMAFRKDAFELVGGIDLNYKYMEDWPLVLKLLRNGYAPAYIDRHVACHSTGGISNSNDAYGVETRKDFYNDKYLMMRSEVDPYKDIITAVDKKMGKLYRREIMDRNYFFDIQFYPASVSGKIKAMLKSPRKMLWVFEVLYAKLAPKVKRKKLLVFAQLLLLSAFFLLQFDGSKAMETFFTVLGYFELSIALLAALFSLISFPVQFYCKRKAALRKKLVN